MSRKLIWIVNPDDTTPGGRPNDTKGYKFGIEKASRKLL